METKEESFNYSERSSRKQPFDKRLIEHIISLIRDGVPRRDIIQKYEVTQSTLGEWIKRYAPEMGKRKSFTDSQKRSIVRSIASGMSVKQAQIAFNISYPSTIRKWLKEFDQENTELSLETAIEMSNKRSNPSDSEEIKALKKALQEANLKNRALNTMIDIAEEHLKIDIRKKSGARQSSK